MPKQGPKKSQLATPPWFANANVDHKTIQLGPFDDAIEAQAECERCMKVGVWLDSKRLYPPAAIVFMEIFEGQHGA